MAENEMLMHFFLLLKRNYLKNLNMIFESSVLLWADRVIDCRLSYLNSRHFYLTDLGSGSLRSGCRHSSDMEPSQPQKANFPLYLLLLEGAGDFSEILGVGYWSSFQTHGAHAFVISQGPCLPISSRWGEDLILWLWENIDFGSLTPFLHK